MKIAAVNGSPRKQDNTATLLHSALAAARKQGAETVLYHLYDHTYAGCTSCFLCKRLDNPYAGHTCAMRDGLRMLLEDVLQCDGILIGTPMYLGDITGNTKAFIERLIFPQVSYSEKHSTRFEGHIATAVVYTMGLPEEGMIQRNYPHIFENNRRYLRLLNGPSTYMTHCDALQFDNYAEFEADKYSEADKRAHHEKWFPEAMRQAEAIGEAMALGSLQ